jgi:predicted ATPase
MRTDLPTGTVTFLFTDVEGSTKLLHELGAETYAEALAEHRRIVREACAVQRGVEVDTQGDAFFFAFPTVPAALAAARAIVEGLAAGPIRVRVGLHTGTPVLTDEGYVGADVHRAARIAAAGHGGQVLVSSATAELVDEALRDLGEHRLKDLGAPQRLYQLGYGVFPPLRTLYRTNLPIQPSPLVGRERELTEAGALIRKHRLLTLTGPGGSGKTRLALQLAADALEHFPDGVFWVPLQALRDPALVERAIAASVGADDGLIEHVANKRLLVLLDNFEQVVEATPTISALLAGTPHATLLVTSREPLQVASEQRYPVEPLPEDDAGVLFVERARAVEPGFGPTAVVSEICRRLDGLPLAIELAAARVAVLDPDELLARLERRLPLLASRSRDAPTRQRTLRATIEWSYELLEPDEQELFRGLAVFRGSFALEAAEAVCDADLDALESLVVKNLVRRWGSGRLGMLDTIREYALERLDDSPEAEELHRRHADYVLALLQDANLTSPKLDARKPMRFDVALAEQDNLRGALDWTLRSGAIALGLELATAADWFLANQDPNEGMRWFRRLFEHPEAEAVAPETRAYALCCYGGSTGISGDFEGAEPLWEQSLALFDQLGDEHGRAVLLHRLSASASVRGDLERARRLLEESHAIHARKTEPLTRAFRLAETTGALGAVARDAGDDERAYALISDSLSAARQSGVEWWEGKMLAELAALFLRAGRVEEAEAHARQSLAIADRLHDRPGCVFGVGLLACLAAERGQPERAGRLWGAIEDRVAAAPLGGWQRHRAACAARMDKVAGPEFEAGRAKGGVLTLDDAVAIGFEQVS